MAVEKLVEKSDSSDADLFTFELDPELVQSINAFSQQMSEVTKNLGLALQALQPVIESSLPGLNRFALQYEKLLRFENKPFIECGLFLAPSMTPGIVSIAVEKYEQGKRKAIPAIVEGFYRRNKYEILKHTVAGWNRLEYFSPRMQIFNDALDAHIAGKWTLSIPALLPHIEGIAGEILRDSGLPITKDVIIVRNGSKTVPSSVFRSSPTLEASSIRYVLIASLLDYLERILYVSVSFEDPKIRILSKLNRHAILHGYNLSYATRLNSLRCFLALDSLSVLKWNLPTSNAVKRPDKITST